LYQGIRPQILQTQAPRAKSVGDFGGHPEPHVALLCIHDDRRYP
jgi:hypothetical protein